MVSYIKREAPTIRKSSYYERLLRRERARISDEEMERLCEAAHCDECEHFEPCACEAEGICDVTTGTLTLYDHDMHVVKVPKKPREWVRADDPSCPLFEPTWTAIREWGER